MTKSEKYYIDNGYTSKGVKECLRCKSQFQIFLTRDIERKLYCSRSCTSKRDVKKIKTLDCQFCKKPFARRTSALKYSNRFCSVKCNAEWKKQQPKEGLAIFHCANCSTPVLKNKKAMQARTNIFCSVSCGSFFNTRRGEASNLYIDGRNTLTKALRRHSNYKKWVVSVYNRDNKHCVKCGSSSEIEAHHIVSFSQIVASFVNNFPDIRKDQSALIYKAQFYDPLWDINNGVTLCQGCHQKEHPNIPLGLFTTKS